MILFELGTFLNKTSHLVSPSPTSDANASTVHATVGPGSNSAAFCSRPPEGPCLSSHPPAFRFHCHPKHTSPFHPLRVLLIQDPQSQIAGCFSLQVAVLSPCLSTVGLEGVLLFFFLLSIKRGFLQELAPWAIHRSPNAAPSKIPRYTTSSHIHFGPVTTGYQWPFFLHCLGKCWVTSNGQTDIGLFIMVHLVMTCM